ARRSWLAPTSVSTRAAPLSVSVSSISTTRYGMSRTRLETEREARLPIEPSSSRLCLLEVRCIEALGEPAADRRGKIATVRALPVAAPRAGQTRGGAHFPELGLGRCPGLCHRFLSGLAIPLA